MAAPVGALEVPEELLQALAGGGGLERTTLITDLPAVVVGSILSRIPNPVDVASAFKAARLFWSVARSAPLRLRLQPGQFEDGASFIGNGDDINSSNRAGYDASKLATWTWAALRGIRSVMRSTQELDLAGCPVLDADVEGLLVDLRCLNVLVLDGCQKLTSSIANALALSVRSGPRVLSLQRCFRLGPAAAGNLLAAAAVDGSHLRALLLSHLNSLDFPGEPPLQEPVDDGIEKERIDSVEVFRGLPISHGTGLCILALHNCGSLGYAELVAISETCPDLEVLMLGGSVDGLGLSGTETPRDKLIAAASALVQTTELLSRLRILEITFFTAPILRAVREQASKDIHVWDFCDKDSVAAAAALVMSLKNPNRPLVEEDFSPGFQDDLSINCGDLLVNECERTESEISGRDGGHVDLEDTNLKEHFIHKEGDPQQRYRQHGPGEKWGCVAEDLLVALRAGANCSDLRKRTPLHVAAALGESEVVVNLISIGAAVRGMKDSSGASALFVAAENGHALVCDQLLRGGADVLASNRSGETPLYIAALRGHASAVDIMLVHCQDRGVNWQDADVYGDCWTPLMAAAVADRQDVYEVILRAAGIPSKVPLSTYPGPKTSFDHGSVLRSTDGVTTQGTMSWAISNGSSVGTTFMDQISGTLSISGPEEQISDMATLRRSPLGGVIGGRVASLPRSVPLFLDAQNRYGQTALHLAARRGSWWFVTSLLHAGASVNVREQYGLRAVDVARKHNRPLVENVLKQWEEEHKTLNDIAQTSTRKKQPGTRKKTASGSKISVARNLNNSSSSSRGGHVWVPKSSSTSSSVADSEVSCGTRYADVADGSVNVELSPLPDSPTNIVPSWMHSSPPRSPHIHQLSAALAGNRDTDGGVEDGDNYVGDIQDALPDHDLFGYGQLW